MLALLNPAHGLIVNFRAAVLDLPADLPALGAAFVIGASLLAAGSLYFRRVERSFADVV